MIALDTNVLVRFIAKDDEIQHRAAAAALARGAAAGATYFVGDVVLAEVVWVLQSRYRLGRSEITTVLKALLEVDHLTFESADRCLRALRRYTAGKGGFPDYLIAERAREEACETILTFDQDLLAEHEFTRP